jgi:hypothetical protein
LSDLTNNSDDAELLLLTDAVNCVSALAAPNLGETSTWADAIYARAVASGNLLAEWMACGVQNIVALFVGDAPSGFVWTDRLIVAHARLGNGGGGVFIRSLGNFNAMIGDYHQAARMYAAADAHIRRVGTATPYRPQGQELFQRTQSALGDASFAEAWAIGERMTLEDVASARQLLQASGQSTTSVRAPQVR